MGEKLVDFWYEWKHACSAENTEGSRWLFILCSIVIPILFITGVVALVLGFFVTHTMVAKISGAVSIIISLGIIGFWYFYKGENG